MYKRQSGTCLRAATLWVGVGGANLKPLAHSSLATRAAIELAKDWRSDRYLRRLEALLLVADPAKIFVVSGNGDVIEPDTDAAAIGSGGQFALAAARALLESSELGARDIVERSLNIAADICIYTNRNLVIDELPGNAAA